MADFPVYFALFLQEQPHAKGACVSLRHAMPAGRFPPVARDPVPGKPPHTHFNNSAMRAALRAQHIVRDQDTYPLSVDELYEAKAYIAEHPELQQAIAIIQAGLQDYFKDLGDVLRASKDLPPLTNMITRASPLAKMMNAFTNEAGGFSFMHDLLPIMASSLARQEKEGGAAPKSAEHQMGRALCDAFRLQAFTSFVKRPLKESVLVCPFSQIITRVFSMKVGSDAPGVIKVEPGGKPGALLSSLMDFIEARQNQAPSSRHYPLYAGNP